MKIVFRLIALGLVAAAAFNYFIYQKNGSIPAREWLASAQGMWSHIANKEGITEPETVKVSKWTDANGVVHYENRPVEGAKTIEVDPNKNVLPPAPVVKIPETKEVKQKTANEEVEALQKAKDAYVESIINN